ncbi:hypothetical protein GCM10023259_090490 [Thermocatellispora tengchongensis]
METTKGMAPSDTGAAMPSTYPKDRLVQGPHSSVRALRVSERGRSSGSAYGKAGDSGLQVRVNGL